MKSSFSTFNHPESLCIVSSFSPKGGETAAENAVSWYTHQLVDAMPTTQRVILLCEKRSPDELPWLYKKNVLILPTYSSNPLTFLREMSVTLYQFPAVKKVLVEFEFNSFKNKMITAQVPLLLMLTKMKGYHVTVALHQVIRSIHEISDHLGLQARSLATNVLNFSIKSFYRSLNLADQVIVFDEELAERLAQYVGIGKIHTIPIGVETAPRTLTQSAARKLLSLSENSFVILCFGYLSWYKGTDWIVGAVGKFAKKHPNAQITLLLAGGESPTVKNKKFSQSLQRLLKKYRTLVHTTGFVKEKDIESYFAAADFVLFPYRAMMSSSGAVSHALKYEKPFLLSSALKPMLHHPDCVNAMSSLKLVDSDLLFDRTLSSFSQKILAVMNDRLLCRRLSRFSTVMKSMRSWKKVAQQHISLVNKLTFQERNAYTAVKKIPELSVFFPLYNEVENVSRLVTHALKTLPKVANKFEVILVNDGSTDGTLELCDRLQKRHKHVRVVHQKNGGYGRALRTGFESAKYDWVFFTDGDLQFKLDELSHFAPHIDRYDAIIGYRKNRADSMKRIVLATLLKIWNTIFFNFPAGIKDIDCAYKLFHRRAVEMIFPLQSYGAMISTEMLLKIIDQNIAVKQIGVTHLRREFGEPTGAKPHVVIGAMKETAKILRTRMASKIQVALGY